MPCHLSLMFFKSRDPGPLNKIKTFSAVSDKSIGRILFMGRPRQKKSEAESSINQRSEFRRFFYKLGKDATSQRCWWHAAGGASVHIHCNENPTYVFLFWERRGLSPNFHIHVSVSDLYSPRIGLHISSSIIGRSVVGIYKSLTDAWIWKLGLIPRYSFSGNICFNILVFCLCSVLYRMKNMRQFFSLCSDSS